MRLPKPRLSMEKTKNILRRGMWLFLVILFVSTGLVVGVVGFYQATHQKKADTSKTEPSKLKGTQMPGYTPVADVPELKITDQTVGSGKEATEGSTVTVQYIGALASSGIIFDTSLDAGQPVSFKLTAGPGGVIPGFAEGLQGMKVGGTRQILIPSDLGYGQSGMPPAIPPNSDLVFTVSLTAVQ